MNEAYLQFLRSKMVSTPDRGIPIEASEIKPILKDHQAAIVRWAVHKGNAAIFAAFGLGKTFMQLEIARLISRHAGGKFLIVAPLGVRQEFRRDAEKLGIELKFVRSFEECHGDGIFLTNYETIRDSKMDPRKFMGCSLDEAAVLRGFGGTKTFREFMRVFENGQVRCGHIHIRPDKCAALVISDEGDVDKRRCECRGAGRLPVTFMLLQPQSWSSEVWTDITRMLSLNSAQAASGREMHLCPMQFDLADRAIVQYTMPGEVVFDPFAGLGTVPMRAVKLGRRGLGIELSARYWADAIYYCEAAERRLATPTLFDLTGDAEQMEVPA